MDHRHPAGTPAPPPPLPDTIGSEEPVEHHLEIVLFVGFPGAGGRRQPPKGATTQGMPVTFIHRPTALRYVSTVWSAPADHVFRTFHRRYHHHRHVNG